MPSALIGAAYSRLFVVRVFSPIARDPLLRDNQGGEVVDNRRTFVRADCEGQPGDWRILRDWHVVDARHPYLGDRSRYHRDTEFRRHQAGDPVKAAQVLLKLVAADNPPVHLLLGSDALRLVREKIGSLNGEIEAWETVSQSTDFA